MLRLLRMDKFVVRKRKSTPVICGPEKRPRSDDAAEDGGKQSLLESLRGVTVDREKWRPIRGPDLCVDFKNQFLPRKLAWSLMQVCEKEIEYFTGNLAQVKVFGKWHNIPRKHVAFGDAGLTYTFSHTTVPAKPWPEYLSSLRDLVSDACGHRFNFVLVNRYGSGSEYMGEHKDDEVDLDREAPIASVSLGQHREFIFRHENSRSGGSGPPRVTIELTHGSLLVMRHPTNNVWYHSLPKRAKATGVRLNFTFRAMRKV